MMSFIVFLCVLSVLILVHEFGHFITAVRLGVRVEKFSLGFGPALVRLKRRHTEYSICLIPIGGYVKMAGDSFEERHGKSYEYFAKPIHVRFRIIFFGPLLNYALGLLCFCLVMFAGYPMFTTKVGGLLDGYGAKRADIRAGDIIRSIDGKDVNDWEELQAIIQSKKYAESVKLVFDRDGVVHTADVSIRQTQIDDNLGKKRSVGLLGITPASEVTIAQHGLFESVVLGAQKTWELTVMTYKGLWRMITGAVDMREAVAGPVQIFFITSKAASLGLVAVLHLLAILNISLAIFNLLPLPILDGGHIFFLLLEKIRGRMLSTKTDRIVSHIGITAILALALFVTYNDILRNFGDKISKFIGK